jgi:tetratricopeptide (TPR) repeat protein
MSLRRMSLLVLIVTAFGATGCRSWSEVEHSLPFGGETRFRNALSSTRLLEQQGEWMRAEQEYLNISRRYPDRFEVQQRLGVLAQKRGDSRESIHRLREAHRLAPENAHVLGDLGYALYLAGDYQQAAEVLRQARRINPSIARIEANLGLALVASGDVSGALSLFKRQGSAAAAHTNVGFALAQHGQVDEARRHFERALDLNPQHQSAAEALVQITDRFSRESFSPHSRREYLAAEELFPHAGSGMVAPHAMPAELSSHHLEEAVNPVANESPRRFSDLAKAISPENARLGSAHEPDRPAGSTMHGESPRGQSTPEPVGTASLANRSPIQEEQTRPSLAGFVVHEPQHLVSENKPPLPSSPGTHPVRHAGFDPPELFPMNRVSTAAPLSQRTETETESSIAGGSQKTVWSDASSWSAPGFRTDSFGVWTNGESPLTDDVALLSEPDAEWKAESPEAFRELPSRPGRGAEREGATKHVVASNRLPERLSADLPISPPPLESGGQSVLRSEEAMEHRTASNPIPERHAEPRVQREHFTEPEAQTSETFVTMMTGGTAVENAPSPVVDSLQPVADVLSAPPAPTTDNSTGDDFELGRLVQQLHDSPEPERIMAWRKLRDRGTAQRSHGPALLECFSETQGIERIEAALAIRSAYHWDDFAVQAITPLLNAKEVRLRSYARSALASLEESDASGR